MRSSRLIVAGDFGATNKRLRAVILASGGREVVAEELGQPYSISEIYHFVRTFLETLPQEPLAMAVGVPGRVSPSRREGVLSYLGANAELSLAKLPGASSTDYALLNDVEAGAFAVMQPLTGERVFDVRTAEDVYWPAGQRRFTLLVPGTGLGVASVDAEGTVHASEGGNMVAPVDPRDSGYKLLASDGDASWPAHRHTFDFLASGAGLPTLMEAGAESDEAADVRRVKEVHPHEQGKVISKLALGNPPSRAARRALAFFGGFLGRCAQALCLTTLNPTVVLGGPLAATNLEAYSGSFLEAFRAHPRHGPFLSSVEIRLMTSATLNLDGAESYARMLAFGSTDAAAPRA